MSILERTEAVPVAELIHGMSVDGLVRTRIKCRDGTEPGWDRAERLIYESGYNLNTPFIDLFSSWTYLKTQKPFDDMVVVNLGAGGAQTSARSALEIAKGGGARAVVSVELYEENAANLAWRARQHMKEFGIPVSVVQEDMLSFLRRLPNKSVAAMCAGIDDCIIDYDYMLAINKELRRTLGGAFLRHGLTIIDPRDEKTASEDYEDKFYWVHDFKA